MSKGAVEELADDDDDDVKESRAVASGSHKAEAMMGERGQGQIMLGSANPILLLHHGLHGLMHVSYPLREQKKAPQRGLISHVKFGPSIKHTIGNKVAQFMSFRRTKEID
jgi:hypothetical protein